MYWTPCARLMKSITPNTSVSPAAIRNSSTPSCRPFRVWTMRRVVDIGSMSLHPSPREAGRGWPSEARTGEGSSHRLRYPGSPSSLRFDGSPPSPQAGEGIARRARSLHRAILDVRIGVVLEHLLRDLGLELAVGALRHLHQIEVLDRIVVGVELEGAAQRLEVGLLQRGAQRVLVVGLAAGRLQRRVDQQRRVIGLERVAAPAPRCIPSRRPRRTPCSADCRGSAPSSRRRRSRAPRPAAPAACLRRP